MKSGILYCFQWCSRFHEGANSTQINLTHSFISSFKPDTKTISRGNLILITGKGTFVFFVSTILRRYVEVEFAIFIRCLCRDFEIQPHLISSSGIQQQELYVLWTSKNQLEFLRSELLATCKNNHSYLFFVLNPPCLWLKGIFQSWYFMKFKV